MMREKLLRKIGMLLLLLLVIAAGGYLGDAYPLLRQAPWDQKTRVVIR